MTARTALVISPFATAPRDAGHRRRVYQTTRVLADAGYHVTFLLVAFEDGWAWSHDGDALAELRAQWDEVMLVYASERVGRPPADGALHGLDEWWDASLEAVLANLAQRRFFDVVVVHNVWLSKAFDFVHPQSVRVLETHDLFWQRAEVFARMGAAPEFFVTDRESELFGIARADIVATIQAQEARTLLALTTRRIVNVPFYEPELAECTPHPLAHPGKTRFGILGSANPFNVHGANALLAALEDEVAATFAPVEVVVAGAVGAHLRTRLPVKRLGRVASETVFYEKVDYAVLPVFDGTGFKIKTADALASGVPLLVSAHAASGTRIDAALVCADAAEMAARMARLSLARPSLEPARAQVRRARADLRERARAGEAELLRAVEQAGAPCVVDLHDAEPVRDALKLQGWLGMARALAAHRKLVLLLAEPVRAAVMRLLPPGVSAPPLWQVDALRPGWGAWLTIDATRGGSVARHRLSSGAETLRDDRWDEAAGEPGEFAGLPLLHPDVVWEPAPMRLRALWTAPAEAPADILAFGPWPSSRRPLPVAAGRTVRLVDSGDWSTVQAWLMRLLAGGGCEVSWAGGDARTRAAILAVCVVADIPFHGAVDGVAVVAGILPSSLRRELDRRVRDLGAALLSRARAPIRRETCQPA